MTREQNIALVNLRQRRLAAQGALVILENALRSYAAAAQKVAQINGDGNR